MLQIISSGKNTQLQNYPQLDTVFSYAHAADGIADFTFFPDQNVFVSINSKSGYELLRTSYQNDVNTIQRIKKRLMNDLVCGATSDYGKGEIALGFNTGQIKFFNIRTNEYSSVKFKADKPENSVIFMGYSSCNEIFSSIHADGDINLYGLNTNVKMSTFKLDQNSTLLRFNQNKRFNMAVASYNGAVTVVDAQTKRSIFQDKLAHTEPCPDLCWSPSMTDILITVGYDCGLNIFDTRRKAMVSQIKHAHPYSTVAVSACGQYCCAGNLKGDIIAYDLRSMKTALQTKRVHDGNVVRVAFVPNNVSNTDIPPELLSTMSSACDRKSCAPSEKEDPFMDFMKITRKRDSIMDDSSLLDIEVRCTKPHEFSTDTSIDSLSLRKSYDGSSESKYKRKSMFKEPPSPLVDSIILEDEVFVSSAERKSMQSMARKSLAPQSVLKENMALHLFSPNYQNTLSPIMPSDHETAEDKENQNIIHKKNIAALNKYSTIGDSSTPNQHKQQKLDAALQVVPATNGTTTTNTIPSITLNMENSPKCSGKCAEMFETLDKNMNEKFQLIVDQINNMSLSMHYNLWRIEDSHLKTMRSNITQIQSDGHLRQDVFLEDYIATKTENEQLKERLNELMLMKK